MATPRDYYDRGEETRTETISRQAPFIEEQQRKLLSYAEGVSTDPLIYSRQQVAGLDPMTTAAFETGRGIGDYQQYLDTGQTTAGTGLGTLQDLSLGVGDKFKAGAGTTSRAIQDLQRSGMGPSDLRFTQAGQAISRAGGQYAGGPTYTAGEFQTRQGPAALDYGAQGFGGGPTYTAGQYGIGSADLGPQSYEAQGFDPSSVSAYMNPYEDQAVQQALSDISRQGDIAQNRLSAQAIGAGAFGGSRQGLQSAELGRNVLEQQAKTAVGMRQAGFQNAMQQAQSNFADQQRRAQAQAQFGTQAGQQAFEDAQRRRQAQAQFGSSTGLLSFEEQQRRAHAQAQFGSSYAQRGFQTQQQAQQQAFEDAQRRRQAQAQFGTQQGQQAFEQARQRQLAMGQGYGGLGGQQAGAQAQYAQTLGGLGSGLAGIGAGQAQEAARLGMGIGSLGTTQANIAGAGQNMLAQQAQLQSQLGALGQTQAQRILDVKHQGDLRQQMEPMQRFGWMGDMLKPQLGSSGSALAMASAAPPSGWSQLIGGGLGALGLNQAIGNPLGNLFGTGTTK